MWDGVHLRPHDALGEVTLDLGSHVRNPSHLPLVGRRLRVPLRRLHRADRADRLALAQGDALVVGGGGAGLRGESGDGTAVVGDSTQVVGSIEVELALVPQQGAFPAVEDGNAADLGPPDRTAKTEKSWLGLW